MGVPSVRACRAYGRAERMGVPSVRACRAYGRAERMGVPSVRACRAYGRAELQTTIRHGLHRVKRKISLAREAYEPAARSKELKLAATRTSDARQRFCLITNISTWRFRPCGRGAQLVPTDLVGTMSGRVLSNRQFKPVFPIVNSASSQVVRRHQRQRTGSHR
jgi:hypothetical protein